jgi:hypothetical protein
VLLLPLLVFLLLPLLVFPLLFLLLPPQLILMVIIWASHWSNELTMQQQQQH